MNLWQPRIDPEVVKAITHFPPAIKHDIKCSLRILSNNPHSGEPLQRELKGLWKYRIRSFRIIYRLLAKDRLIHIVAIGHRKTIYDVVRQQHR